MKTECPNCNSIWGIGSEEWEWQQCDCCGWPYVEDDLGDDNDWSDDDEQEFDGIILPPKISE